MPDVYDLVIVGGGVAGMAAALSAPSGTRVAVVDKGEAEAGSSPLAQGGLAAAIGEGDSIDLHVDDTLRAGAGICDEAVVRDICAAGPPTVEWLLSLGCGFDRAPGGAVDRAHEGGQTVPRSVHWRDATGAEIVRALREIVRGRAARFALVAEALVVGDGRCLGVWAGSEPILGRATLLATGGAGALWSPTTNAPGATGDGIAMALASGVDLADLEFMQFHPTVLDAGGRAAQRALLTEALRGAGATLVDERGERFVDEMAPRHVVTAAILARERAFLDCRGVSNLAERFPTIVETVRARGFDPESEPLPVRPAAHYFIGGVAADAGGRTSLPGLFSAGECAATGMHGANRMAGNSLLEAIVVGRRVGADVEPGGSDVEPGASDVVPSAAAVGAPEARTGTPGSAIPGLMWGGCGPIRTEEGLARAARALAALPPSPHRDLCALVVEAARARAETRGVHVRADHPESDPARAVRSRVRPAAAR
ncbi:MAG: FAD-binding protein [Acidobacteria bacterium]|nr:FAD-binding protein [Acidobacteriota bacterium]